MTAFLPPEPVNSVPAIDQVPAIVDAAMAQMRFAREYLLELLDATEPERWFEIPAGLPTNIAWQIGHLTVAQYGLLLFRIRGRSEADLELIPSRFRKAYGKSSTPSSDPSAQPTADEFIDRLDRVWQTALTELPQTDPTVFLEPVGPPFAGYANKLGCILFAPMHEQIHSGQVGLIRRGLGMDPIR